LGASFFYDTILFFIDFNEIFEDLELTELYSGRLLIELGFWKE